jgi:hypothetical protein
LPLTLWYRGPFLHHGIKFAPSLPCVWRAWQVISSGLRPPHTPRGRGQRGLPATAASLAPQGGVRLFPFPRLLGGLCTLSSIMRDLPLIMSPGRHAIVEPELVCSGKMRGLAWPQEASCRRSQPWSPRREEGLADGRSAQRPEARGARTGGLPSEHSVGFPEVGSHGRRHVLVSIMPRRGEACMPQAEGPLDYALSPVGLLPRARARRIPSPRVSRWREHACNHEGTAS